MDPLIRFHHSTRRLGFREDVREKKFSARRNFAPRMMQIRVNDLNSNRFVITSVVLVAATNFELTVIIRIAILLEATLS